MKSLVMLLAVALVGSAFAAEIVLQPDPGTGKDAMLNASSPSTNYGTYTRLMVNYGTGRTVRGIVEFTGISTIPANSTVNSAKLELWKQYTNNPNDQFGIYRVTASWQEMVVTWANQPAHNSTAYVKTLVQGGKWYEWDVKTLVQEWVNRTYPNYGFKLIRDNESGGAWPYFVSSDYATATYRPKLTVNYTPSGVAPTSMGKLKALFQ
ncbi:MAG: DNRLRE domain-containing protein [Candidatus Coatesbacteria bacterium]|nr:MAG: DNRLRE domain-containing protein [Candidatus Coatesbacteria bacterium]